jgi:hypothetical protein
MFRRSCFTVAIALLPVAACEPAPSTTEPAGTPLFLIGDTPTTRLLDVTGAAFEPNAETIVMSMSTVPGLFEAARGYLELGWAIELAVKVENEAGQSWSSDQQTYLLTDVKLADPRPDPVVAFDLPISWSGTAEGGEAFGSPATLSYSASLVFSPSGQRTVLASTEGAFSVTW